MNIIRPPTIASELLSLVGKLKESAGAAGRKVVPVAAPVVTVTGVSYAGITFEPLAHRKSGRPEKELFYFGTSLESLRARNLERHASGPEVFGLLADSLEGKLASPVLRSVAEDMLTSYGEWLSLAFERKGDVLIVYVDPEGLNWNSKSNKYVKTAQFKCARNARFDIAGKPSHEWIELEKFDDSFVVEVYGRPFGSLPSAMRKGGKLARVILPADGAVWPVGRGNFDVNYNVDGYNYNVRASRGVGAAPQKNFP